MPDRGQSDRAIEQLLRRGAGAPPRSAAPGPCVDGEMLAAWSLGALAREDASRVEAHLADCTRCQAMLAAFARTEPVSASPAPWWQRAHLRWLVPLATAATVAAIWVAIPQRTETPTPREPANTPSEQPFKSEPFVVPSQPAPGVPPESMPTAKRAARSSGQEGALARREAASGAERKQEPAPRRADETDARSRAGDRFSSERAAAAPAAAPAAPNTAAPPPAAALKESVTAAAQSPSLDTMTPRPLAEGVSIDIVSPGGATRWRIVAGQVQRSTTQGKSWDAIALPSATIAAGHAPSASVAWFVGRTGAIFVTTDGTRFDLVPFVSSTDLVLVVAVDSRQATVTTVDGRRFRTENRGATWTQQ